jgi:membrane-associated phospholipid phosphatase
VFWYFLIGTPLAVLTFLAALSRKVLGLHHPSDVLGEFPSAPSIS